jgi:hypothetical protein
MPPLNDKVIFRVANIYARDGPSCGEIAAYIVAGILGSIALAAFVLICLNIRKR